MYAVICYNNFVFIDCQFHTILNVTSHISYEFQINSSSFDEQLSEFEERFV